MSNVTLNIRVYGMPQYIKKMNKLGKDLSELDKPMKNAGEVAKAALRSYPPYDDGWKEKKESFSLYRPGSKYKRKGGNGGLKTGWKGRLIKGSRIGVRYLISNSSIKYAKYVQGYEQSSFHAPWWLTVEEWVPVLRPEVTEIFREFIRNVAKGAT